MKDKPFITVMVLCYNCAHLVGKALNAVAKQSFRDFELLFIDNGSTDKSMFVFESFMQEHQGLNARSISIRKNRGPTHGWNEGLKYASGEFVIFNDADDWMDEDCLYELAKKAVLTGSDRVTGQYREVAVNGQTLRDRKFASEKIKRLPTAMLQATIFRRKVFETNNIMFPEQGNLVAYDSEIVFRFASCEKNQGVIVSKTIYNYLVHIDSVIQNSSSAENVEKYYEDVTKPMINVTARIKGECRDKKLGDSMEYLVIRNYYSRILSLYQKVDEKVALNISTKMRLFMEQQLPSYRKNPYLKPIRNGYEQPGSFVLWLMSILEEMNCLEIFVRLISRIIHNTKYLR